MNDRIRSQVNRVQAVAVVAALLGFGGCAAMLASNQKVFFQSYLVGFLFWLGFALGCGGFALVYHLTGGRWGDTIGFVLEAAMRTLPVLAVLFVPVLVGMKRLYVWADPGAIVGEHLREAVHHKAPYLNVSFFIARAAIYFVFWAGGAWVLAGWARRRRLTGDDGAARRLRAWSGPGLIFFVITVTFAAVDWVMSLDPTWYSTIYGFMFVVGDGLAGLSLSIIVVIWRAGGRTGGWLKTDTLHDLGNLLLMAVSLWAYMSFSQYLIIWYANLPEEITWYVPRNSGMWNTAAIVLIVFHFAVPLAVLLSRQSKRLPAVMVTLAVGLIAMHFLDLLWVTVPSFGRVPVLSDVAATVGIGGVWAATFLQFLKTSAKGVGEGTGTAGAAHGV